MRKEDILEKAQKDEDEMEKATLEQSLGFSTIIIPVLCIMFVLIRILNSEYIVSDLVAITLAQLSISQIYQSIKMKKTSSSSTRVFVFLKLIYRVLIM